MPHYSSILWMYREKIPTVQMQFDFNLDTIFSKKAAMYYGDIRIDGLCLSELLYTFSRFSMNAVG